MTDIEKFKAEALEKNRAYEARIIPQMRSVQAFYADRHGLGIMDNATRSPRR